MEIQALRRRALWC